MMRRGAVMPTRNSHSTIGTAVQSALDHITSPEQMAMMDPHASRQMYGRLDSYDIDVAEWRVRSWSCVE